MKKLYLIDGHSLIFRMYYAFLRRPMINSKGEDTSILFGFTKFLLEFINKEKPTHLAVAFDPPVKTFRHQMYTEYKANRQATPELIKSSLDPLIEIVKCLNIPVLMEPGYEADDVIGSMAKKAERDGYLVYMLTPDKDYGQLVSRHIYQCKPAKSGSDLDIVTEDSIKQQYDINDPSQVIDILTLWGDASDNIPGVRGIGEVGAKKLISTYGSVESIYDHLDELSEKQRVAFEEAKEYIYTSKTLVTIKTDIPLACQEEELRLDLSYCPNIEKIFSHYEFNSLMKYLPNTITGIQREIDDSAREVVTYKKVDLQKIAEISQKSKEISLVFKTSGFNNKDFLTDLILACNEEKENYVYIASGSSMTRESPDYELIKKIMESSSIVKTGSNLKLAYKTMAYIGININGYLADLELLHYLINPERSHRIDMLINSYLPGVTPSLTNMESRPSDLFSQNEPDEHSLNNEIIHATVLRELRQKITEELVSMDMLALYDKIERPLIKVLGDMEMEGFKIDVPMLKEYSSRLQSQMDKIEEEIRDSVGEPSLNISSPKQLGVILYEKLKLNPNVKKNNKQNYPTDEETLNELSDKHPVVNNILEYRGIKKLLSTYIDPFPNLIDPQTGKVHTTFNQALTATGRLSSVKPNLQNIPIRSEMGREIRKAFIPSTEDSFIISADYSQIELRLMAVLSDDQELIRAFAENKDIHTSTAAKIFKKEEKDITKQERNRAKVANFGIIYGISAFGLSQRLYIPRKEATQMIEDYFTNFPAVKRYMDQTINMAKERGYVETIYGRKRFLPDINSKNPTVRGLSERNAINAPIQGSAADIIKIAMINVAEKITLNGLKSKMILQVHDELVFDVFSDELEIMLSIVKQEMENVVNLSVKLISDCNYGKNWLEAH